MRARARLPVWLLAGAMAAMGARAVVMRPLASRANDSACRWVSLGPDEVPDGEGYDSSRVSVSGRVTALAFEGDGADGTLYVGSALGGVWRTRDNGRHWSPVTDHEVSLAVGALAADPLHRSTLYVGTGELNLALRQQVVAGDRPLTGHRGRGLLKSVDGGDTWTVHGAPQFSGGAFGELAVSPGRLLAATTQGLFRSVDGGDHWQRLEGGVPTLAPASIATSVLVHPGRRSTAYAAFWGTGVYRTDDIEAEMPVWTRAMGGLPLSNIGRIGLASSPAAPNRLYALVATVEGLLRGLYTSADGGDSWQIVNGTPDILQGQGFYNLLVAAHPLKADVVFIGGSGSRRYQRSSLFRGTLIDGAWQFAPIGAEMHIDLHAMAFHSSDADVFWVGGDGGLWSTRDGGRSWTALNKGLVTMQLGAVAQPSTTRAFLVAGTQDNGTLVMRGRAWSQVDDGDGGTVAISQQNPGIVYRQRPESNYGAYQLARSAEAGASGSFMPIYPAVKASRSVLNAPFALDPARDTTVALGLDRLYVSEDSGSHWRAATIDLSKGWTSRFKTNAISAVLFAESDLIFAGTSDGQLWSVRRQNGVWRPLNIPTGAPGQPPAGRYVTDLARSRRDPFLLYVAYDGDESSLWRCRMDREGEASVAACAPATGTGTLSLPAGPIFTVEVDPTEPEIVYAGTEDGVFRSSDGGDRWTSANHGLPHTTVSDLARHRTLPLLRAATFGRGLWELDLTCAATADLKP